MNDSPNHISVCICTYNRPQYLKRLLDGLRDQDTNGLFTYSVVVADNDHLRSAEPLVSAFGASSSVPVRYCVETRKNIPLARNTAIENADGDLIAFIDDDEFPPKRWLLILFEAWQRYGADGVLGPVKPYFDEKAPSWVVRGRFYHRPTYPTGSVIRWTMGRTGNVLFEKRILAEVEEAFRPEFHRGGADQDFFRRMIEKGHVFIWCDDAVVHEIVPPVRWKRSFMLRKALLQGSFAPLHPTNAAPEVLTSLIAVPAYTVALPFDLVLGHHIFMTHLEKLCYHAGRLSGYLGVKLVKVPHLPQ